MKTERVEWIAVDWGTSVLRCWAMGNGREVLAQAVSQDGMAAVAAQGGDFEAALLELIQPWLRAGETIPVRACGMVGARQGWIEVAYEAVPCSPRTTLTKAPTRSGEIEVRIHAGVSQDSPADVMRGEETQVSGLLVAHPRFEGLVCLPGTHSKWVQVAGGKIQRFRTFLTGELFGLLAEHSVLRHTVAPEGWDEPAFLDALHAAMECPGEMLAQCFGLRAEALLHNLDGVAARSRLSGILIGQELAGALNDSSTRERIALIGSAPLIESYRVAIEAVGRQATIFCAQEFTLAGLGR